MKPATYTLGIALALLLSGCVLSGKPQQKVNVTPAPPKPPSSAPATTAASPQGPLSIPQTVADLPAPQPISADALQTTTLRPPEEPAETQPGPRTLPRRSGPPPGPPRAETTTSAPPQPAPTTPPPEQVERLPVQEILPPAEQKKLQDSVETHKRDIKRVLDRTNPRRLNPAQLDLVARIRTLVQQSDEAGTRNDWRQADSLAGQALTLVRELTGAR